ncbi:hypothetical protein WB334_25335, partial [Escherichia coli]|uniref:hypothetical protein n=1 Tax=Escherichia coli TaxID=562 RepID=UPI0021571C98
PIIGTASGRFENGKLVVISHITDPEIMAKIEGSTPKGSYSMEMRPTPNVPQRGRYQPMTAVYIPPLKIKGYRNDA